jgi:hypothetical protein
MRAMVLAIIIVVAIGAGCSADKPAATPSSVPSATDSLRTDTREWLSTLDSLRRVSPATADTVERVARLFGQMTLGKLGFGARYTAEDDDRTQRAVREFERTRGLPETGNALTPATYNRLVADAEALDAAERPIIVPSKMALFDEWDRGYLRVDGGWRAANTRLADRAQAVRIECFQDRRSCHVLYAKLTGYGALSIEDEEYRVTSWTPGQVAATLDYPCARHDLIITRHDTTAKAARSTRSTTGRCEHMDPNTIHLELVDGHADPGRQQGLLSLWLLGPDAKRLLSNGNSAERPSSH